MATTPPPRSAVRTPPTPLHGPKFDTYQPYPTRKSTRFLSQRVLRTPSPTAPNIASQHSTTSMGKRSSGTHISSFNYSPPLSAQASPVRKLRRSPRVLSDTSFTEVRVMDFENQQRQTEKSNDGFLKSGIDSTTVGMLPTPVKTPRKKDSLHTSMPAGRVLFPSRPETIEEAMPTPRKANLRSRRQNGFPLGGGAENLDNKIEIYTDSKDKVPVIDESEDNPFYVKPSKVEISKDRTGRGKKARIDDTPTDASEALRQDEGIVYVFRGKRVFRKFDEALEPDSPTRRRSTGAFVDVHSSLDPPSGHRRLTRSSLKPRRLFPPKALNQSDVDDEEAVTDIEDPQAHKTDDEPLITPVQEISALVSPPTTGHVTRASTRKAALDSSPIAAGPITADPRFTIKKGNVSSPFENWQRSKPNGASVGKSKKRGAADLEGVRESSKKAKRVVS